MAAGAQGVAVPATAPNASAVEQGAGSKPELNSAPDNGSRLQDIVVTARRKTESLQSVPVAASAFSGAALATRGVVDIRDFSSQVPSLQINQSTSSSTSSVVNLRGQEAQNISIAFDPAVGVYFDEVYLGRSTGNLLSTLQDMEGVEVLRGVQGTLFGRNSNGGAIVLRPNRPELDHFDGSLNASYGSRNRVELGAVINIPLISDTLAIRASGNWLWRDGYQRSVTTGINDFGDRNRGGGRIALRAVPIEKLTIDVTYDMSRLNETGTLVARYIDTPFDSSTASVGDPVSKGKTDGVTGKALYDFGRTQAKLIFGYRSLAATDIIDIDGGPSTATDYYLRKTQHQYSGELNVNSKLVENNSGWFNSLDLTSGLFYFTESGRETRQIPYFATPLTGTQPIDQATNRSKAAYAQLEAKMFDALSVFGGGRYTRDNRRMASGTIAKGVCVTDGLSVDDCFRRGSAKFGYWSWTGGTRYAFTSDTQVYAKVSRGVRAGGLDNNTVAEFQPEKLTEYEIGLKAEWFDRKLRTNVAAYHGDFRNIQRSGIVTINGLPFASVTNAASAVIQGVEFEGTLIPTRGLTLSGTFGYTDAYYQKYLRANADGSFTDLTQKKLPDVAKWTWSIAADYGIPIATGKINLHTDFGYRTKTYLDVTNVEALSQKGYGILNGRVSYAPDLSVGPFSHFDIAVFGRNLTNRKYIPAGTLLGINNYAVFRSSEPRTIGVEVAAHF